MLKSIAINTLYGTQVLVIIPMAEHVCNVLNVTPTHARGSELVEQIAALPHGDKKKKGRRFISFAAKFCHFFIDEEQYPIYDEAARETLKLHLGQDALFEDKEHPYRALCANLQLLRERAQLRKGGRDLDHYLWITGMYMKWLRLRKLDPAKQAMNVEIRSLFEGEGPEWARLDAVLPNSLERPKRDMKPS